MLTQKNIDQLAAAVEALNGGDALPLAALAPLTELSESGVSVAIDFSAQSQLGAPLIVARPQPRDTLLDKLSPKRRLVADLIVQGLPNKEIANRLDLSIATVKDHVHAVLRQCGCRSRTELMAMVHGTRS